MSFQTFVTERLAALTAQYNAIVTNAKKIDELPVQEVIDTSSKIHVSRAGTSESIELQNLINAISSGDYNRLIFIGVIDLVANLVTIPANAKWTINNINYENTSEVEIPIPYCATGLSRKDILVANTLNDIVLIQGVETGGSIVIRPNIPAETVLVSEMDVTDSTVGTLTNPVVGDYYLSKTAQKELILNGSWYDGDTIVFFAEEGTTYRIQTIGTSGFLSNTYNVFGAPFEGQEISVKNETGASFPIKHLLVSGTLIPFSFPTLQDYIVQNNENLKFKFINGAWNYNGTITSLINPKIYLEGDLQIFKRNGNVNNLTIEAGDLCSGIIETSFIKGVYVSGDPLLKASFDIISQTDF